MPVYYWRDGKVSHVPVGSPNQKENAPRSDQELVDDLTSFEERDDREMIGLKWRGIGTVVTHLRAQSDPWVEESCSSHFPVGDASSGVLNKLATVLRLRGRGTEWEETS